MVNLEFLYFGMYLVGPDSLAEDKHSNLGTVILF